jgi:hypothetical protein
LRAASAWTGPALSVVSLLRKDGEFLRIAPRIRIGRKTTISPMFRHVGFALQVLVREQAADSRDHLAH